MEFGVGHTDCNAFRVMNWAGNNSMYEYSQM